MVVVRGLYDTIAMLASVFALEIDHPSSYGPQTSAASQLLSSGLLL
jgi:hypothetical protein